jgi:uncharacterized membrane-anchored protein YjiN (DUF445 family)
VTDRSATSDRKPVRGFALDARDLARARDLQWMKLAAAGVLVGSIVVLIVARILQGVHPGFGYLAAFAEAATIGGLADWYAVVVLFRRPLGLPIPHTAIIPENQPRIAEKLGEFIEEHFLAPEPVEAKLREVDFARFMSDWLRDEARSESLARFVLRLAPEALTALEQSGLKTFATRRILMELQALDLRPIVAGALESLTASGRHQRLLDDLLGAFARLIQERETLDALRERIREELPSLLRLYRADAWLLKRLVGSVSSFFEEVRTDPDHAFRAEFDGFLKTFVERLSTSQDYETRLEQLKRDLLARPEFGDLARHAWTLLRNSVIEGTAGPNPPLLPRVQKLFMEAGRHLGEDAPMRAEVNEGMVVILRSFVEAQKSGVSTFIADQVKSWDMDQLVTLIEINIGRDLQYIRFNGALIGGLAGLVLHAVEQMLRIA